MNIFYLDENPKLAAQYLIDKHVNKMLTEAAQILSNCYTLEELESAPLTQKGTYRKHSYPHHPCCKWIQQSDENFMWLIEHAKYMNEEKIHRFGTPHFSICFINWCENNWPNFEREEWTTPALAMNDYPQFQDYSRPVESYRKFYVADKQIDNGGHRMDIYSKRERPSFWYDYVEYAEFSDYMVA